MSKHHRAEDWLPVLHWGLGLILSPSPARIFESFEAFEHRHRLRSDFRKLRRAGWLVVTRRGQERVFKVTPSGTHRARGSIDPVEQWGRAWDGRWRMLLFDLPSRPHARRRRLWRWLRREHLGYLQNSVWISPDPIRAPIQCGPDEQLPAESVVEMLATPGEPGRDREIAAAAWDFESLNRCYEECLDLLDEGVELLHRGSAARPRLRGWLARERMTWSAALEHEPLLPRRLYPSGYAGETVWRRRADLFSRLARTLFLRP